MRRRASRTDANHADVMRALRAVGCSVQDLSAVGQGCPDLLIGVSTRNIAMEVKDGAKGPSRRKLTPAQVDWHGGWRGQACVVSSADEALAIVAAIRAEAMDGWEP